MPLAVLVEGLESNPIVLLDPILLKGEDLPGQLDAALDAYNAAHVVSRATSALLWYDDRPNQTFEYFRDERAVRAQRFRETISLTGFHTCSSGRRYWYYGKCVGWLPGKRTYWEARLFHHDKKFVFDGPLTSLDVLAKFDGEFLGMDLDVGMLKALAEPQLFEAIEDWDRKLEVK
ncbi:hypothetical protein L6654_14075 [Bradyrhizobium sp. WYCCWR 13023]|uniref:Uncharacterized protein n=1 Tax=Bradyrhizobium zhengyangense TaxID=2911009 RepID=A0A9X1RB12_9BRAD|nr:hypothetical protein [Bradyrhizobium zhengyangense]MCG2627758.1 hypothetical protein [Bradyrhizobium zhengyangense]MCG2669819.1 hypothetical protein [Bradyrhizobium zhengyangense]